MGKIGPKKRRRRNSYGGGGIWGAVGEGVAAATRPKKTSGSGGLWSVPNAGVRRAVNAKPKVERRVRGGSPPTVAGGGKPPAPQAVPKFKPRPAAKSKAVPNKSSAARTAGASSSSTSRTTATPRAGLTFGALPDAGALVDAQIQPLLQSIDENEKRTGILNTVHRQAITDYARSLVSDLGKLGPATAQDYTQQIQQTTGLANAGAAGLSAASPNADIQATLGAAPQTQRDAVMQQLSATYGGGADVLRAVAGTIPSQALAAQGGARAQQYDNLAAAGAAQGKQDLLRQLWDEYGGAQAFADQRRDVAARRGGLEAETRLSLANIGDSRAKAQADWSLNQQQLTQREQEAALDATYKQQGLTQRQQYLNATLGLRAQNQRFTQGATKVRLGQGATRLQQGNARLQLSALQADRSWQAQLRRLGISDASLQLRASELEAKRRNKGKKGGFTALQLSKLRGTAATIADVAFNGGEDGDGNPLPQLGWQDAINEMLKEGVPLNLAIPALARLYKPRERGRPRRGYYSTPPKKR